MDMSTDDAAGFKFHGSKSVMEGISVADTRKNAQQTIWKYVATFKVYFRTYPRNQIQVNNE